MMLLYLFLLTMPGQNLLKGKGPSPLPGSVKTELGGWRGRGVPFPRCYLFSLTMFCEPCKANSTIPAWRVGRQRSSQHLGRASALALGARFSEKLGRLGAKLFSNSDPYFSAFQEAQGFRNLAMRIDPGHLGKLGQDPHNETT